jgi:hypothetical protein
MHRSPECGPGREVTLTTWPHITFSPGYAESPPNQGRRRLACEGAGFRLRPKNTVFEFSVFG